MEANLDHFLPWLNPAPRFSTTQDPTKAQLATLPNLSQKASEENVSGDSRLSERQIGKEYLKNIRIKKRFLITGLFVEIGNDLTLQKTKSKIKIYQHIVSGSWTNLHLQNSSKKFDGISMNGSKGLVSTASIALVEYLVQRAHTQCISTTTKSTTTQPPVWAMLTFRHRGDPYLPRWEDYINVSWETSLPCKKWSFIAVWSKTYNNPGVCSIWLHKYSVYLSFQKRWWSKNLNHLLDFGSYFHKHWMAAHLTFTFKHSHPKNLTQTSEIFARLAPPHPM